MSKVLALVLLIVFPISRTGWAVVALTLRTTLSTEEMWFIGAISVLAEIVILLAVLGAVF